MASENPPNPSPAGGVPYTFAGALRRVSGGRDGIKTQPFDLQSRLGKGKPVALIFWAPEFPQTERSLIEWATFLRHEAPQYEVYAICGRTEAQRDEEFWENYSMMDLPDLPLLVDDDFKVSKALDVMDVPNLTLFNRKGGLVIAKIKHPEQLLVLSGTSVKAEAVIRKVAAGDDVPTIERMFPYYPAVELYGHCAPRFTLRKFGSNEPYTFTGHTASGRPTMLIFWSSVCKHCQVEIPQIVSWLKTHPDTVDIVSVTRIKPDHPNGPSHRKITEAYIRAQGISWVVLEDPDGAVTDLYGSVSTPTTYFITPDGTVVNAWFYPHQPGALDDAMTKELTRARLASRCEPPAVSPAATLDFSVMGPDGKRVPLASLLDRPAMVHFWATWCAPCVKELPSLVRLRDKWEKDGESRVILVSVEDESSGDKILKFQKSLGLDLRTYRAPKGGLADKIDLAYRVPRTFLVGSGGSILGSRQGEQDWDNPEVIERVHTRLENSGRPLVTASKK